MLAPAVTWKNKRDELRARRRPLFESYEKSPHDFHLALEIKLIDDQIAECTKQMVQERESRN